MLRLTPPGSSDLARVPKACVPCARAKVKCEIEAEDGICQRCRRLKKQCSMQMPGAHRRKRPKPYASDVARLEQKLDNVAAILSASERARQNTNPGSQTPIASPTAGQYGLSPTEIIRQFIPSDREAEMMLDHFRVNMMPHFPFVIIPAEVSLNDLRREKPFLFTTVMMVGCRHDASRQVAIASKIREIISYSVLVKGEQSLDMLQGLLIYLAWYHFHLRLGSQLTNLFHLIMAMMTDLCLNNAAHPKSPSKLALGLAKYFEKDGQPHKTRTLEERRAYLGVFYLTSIVSLYARNIDSLRYTKYTEECCQLVAEAAEYPTDTLLIQLMRVHRLADKIKLSLSLDELEVQLGVSAPIGAYVRSLESELVQLKHTFPQDIPGYTDLLMNYYALETFLYAVALNERMSAVRYGNFPMARLEILLSCLESTKACFDTFHSFSPSSYFYLPYPLWSQLGHAIIVLSKLSLFNGEGWDQEYVRSQMDFFEVLSTFDQKLEEAREYSRSTSQASISELSMDIPEIFVKLTPNLQQMKECHKARLQAQTSTTEQTQGPPRGDSGSASSDDLVVPDTAGLFEFLDDSFWRQFT
ncbi:transcriptional regulator family: Fungal Specific TF [Paecilomyces variotii]|nr:transcriptional regulator family: Fungal Specific TF [Paecilomyces variotii]KAJ9350234.1 transcriptional regulator family: Fungal Specific TF [Paecilomyces variotii]KAJ9368861.1 transcriptional regulator family: Fungal Specific TF [Paecilomyces variotii]KAJ9396628.1 transcriptional regulator family: Fungal Specific TF [Paecilomyces variotii]